MSASEQNTIVKVHLGFAPNRIRTARDGRLIAFAIDEQRRYWGWFLKSARRDAAYTKSEVRIVRDGDEFPIGFDHVGSEFETLDKGGLEGYHALTQR